MNPAGPAASGQFGILTIMGCNFTNNPRHRKRKTVIDRGERADSIYDVSGRFHLDGENFGPVTYWSHVSKCPRPDDIFPTIYHESFVKKTRP